MTTANVRIFISLVSVILQLRDSGADERQWVIALVRWAEQELEESGLAKRAFVLSVLKKFLPSSSSWANRLPKYIAMINSAAQFLEELDDNDKGIDDMLANYLYHIGKLFENVRKNLISISANDQDLEVFESD